MNVSGTLLEGIALWGELRPIVTRKNWSIAHCAIATWR